MRFETEVPSPYVLCPYVDGRISSSSLTRLHISYIANTGKFKSFCFHKKTKTVLTSCKQTTSALFAGLLSSSIIASRLASLLGGGSGITPKPIAA